MTLTLKEQITFLINSIPNTERIVFFTGAGTSVSAGVPLWNRATSDALKLATERGLSDGAKAYATEKLVQKRYYDVFDVLERELPEPAFIRIAFDIFCKKPAAPSEIHKMLVSVPSRGIITTNFDECLSTAFAIERKDMPISDIRTAMASDRFFIVKPHGTVLDPKSMVLSTRGWQQVEMNSDFKGLLARVIGEYQLVFLGYGFGDPDFEQIWSRLLVERRFRLPALYCCPEGAVTPARMEQFRAKNIQVLEFSDDGSFAFVPKILQELLKCGKATTLARTETPPERAAQELEKYVFLCMQFSATQQDRLVLVSKAIGLDVFSHLNNGTINKGKFLDRLCEILGQDSAMIRSSGEVALEELGGAGFISRNGDQLTADSEKLGNLINESSKFEKAEREWVGRVLRGHAELMRLEIGPKDYDNVLRVLDRVLLDAGRELAELILFNRLPKEEFKSIDDSIDEIARTTDFAGKRELFRRVVRSLLFEPEEKDEDLLFKKIQAYFISTAYVLNPTSERLLSQYVRNHRVYFDSSIVLPALALGHPSHSVYRSLLRRTQALGMRLSLFKDMLDEVWANVRTAISGFNDFQNSPTSLEDALSAYVTMHGAGHGNVFLEGFLNQLETDRTLTPQAYMSAVFFTPKGFKLGLDDVKRTLTESYGVEVDDLKNSELDNTKLERIVGSIEHLRKVGDRYHSRRLCEHEARQFYLVHLRREQNPELATKIWYVTTDRFVSELQRLEQDKYPLPISYTPRAWFQYLALVDFESRSSRHFSRFQPKMRVGVLSGEIGIEAIRMIVQEQRDLLKKGAVTLKQLAEATVADFNVRQVIADTDQSMRQNEISQADGRERIRQTISKSTGQYVAMRVDELEKLRKDVARERDDRIKAEKKLAKEKYVSRTLKAQSKYRKKGKKR